ncbi:MAG: alpha amylase C-terminal domain-containing protein [Lachnospiraceae bacterium]|nr:alpha amylase C-terminal domain-containing protein [Candidatus Colinaster scatohippi]
MKDKLYKMMNWPEIEAIVYGEEAHPDKILGRQFLSTNTLFQTYLPDAKEVILVIEDEKGDKNKEYIMELADEEGFYATALRGKAKGKYHYSVTDIKGKKSEKYDPYDFDVTLDRKQIDKFVSGESVDAYEFMGAHLVDVEGISGVVFRVWAPNAIRVSVVGAFNNWNGKTNPMIKDDESGIFSLFVPGLKAGEAYKFEISARGGLVYTKQDPYAFKTSKGCAVVSDDKAFDWKDELYLATESKNDKSSMPFNIYETELTAILDSKGKLTAKGISSLVERTKICGYNYVQLMMGGDFMYMLPSGIASEEIKKMVQAFHNENIGVIYVWNPSYFAVDDEGMGCFDGTYLYGHLDERKRYNTAFSGYYYNFGRPEVKSYLMSNAAYWMKNYHFDGMFVEGLSSILYLDYGKYDGEWTANMYGGHENLEAISFIKDFNTMLNRDYPYAFSITREEGAFPKVTDSISEGGLGFDYLWNNGLAEDYLAFVRSGNKDLSKLTDNMSYAYCENYIVTMSKDDVTAANNYDYLRVENGSTYFDGIEIADDEKEALKRATLAYLMAHPGKKLIYKGQDDEKVIAELNALYKKLPALNKKDRSGDGFEWINAINNGDGIISFLRKDEYINHTIFVVCNFSDKEYKEYKFGVPYEGKYKMIFTSDDKKFGGRGSVNNRFKCTEEEAYDGRSNCLKLKLAPRSVSFYTYIPYSEDELLKLADEKLERIRKQLVDAAKEKARLLNERSSKN